MFPNNATPPHPPPDLEIRIRLSPAPAGTALTYTLHSAAAGFHFEDIPGPVLRQDLGDYADSLFKQIEKLCARVDIDGGPLLQGEAVQELASLGQSLYRDLFPPLMREAYRRFRGVRSIQITSDDPAIPWEMLKPYDDATEPPVDDDFFCLRFQLTRWRDGRAPATAFSVRKLACFGGGELPKAADEHALLAGLAGRHPGVEDASPPTALYEDVASLLKYGGCDLLHFVGHGDLTPGRPDEAKILLEDRPLRARHLTGAIATRLKRDRPLVFLNACRAARQGWSLTGLGGWVEAFVRTCECGAFIGPQWVVRDSQAHELARIFYGELEHGRTLGEAALEARRAVWASAPGQPAWLAFAVYGHPHARVHFGDPVEGEAGTEMGESSATPFGLSRTAPFMPEQPPEDFVERPDLIEPVIATSRHDPRPYGPARGGERRPGRCHAPRRGAASPHRRPAGGAAAGPRTPGRPAGPLAAAPPPRQRRPARPLRPGTGAAGRLDRRRGGPRPSRAHRVRRGRSGRPPPGRGVHPRREPRPAPARGPGTLPRPRHLSRGCGCALLGAGEALDRSEAGRRGGPLPPPPPALAPPQGGSSPAEHPPARCHSRLPAPAAAAGPARRAPALPRRRPPHRRGRLARPAARGGLSLAPSLLPSGGRRSGGGADRHRRGPRLSPGPGRARRSPWRRRRPGPGRAPRSGRCDPPGDPRIVARHGDEANACALSADGALLASASHDGTVRLWGPDGQPLQELTEHAGPVRDCAFQPGDGLLASVSTDIGVGSTLKVWDPGDGRCLASLRVDGELSTCGWFPEGDALFAVGQYGAYLLDWSP